MQEEPMSGQDSLRIIEEMINTAKSHFNEDGHLLLLWGWIVSFCSVTDYLVLRFAEVPWHSVVWLLTWVALGYQFWYIRNKRRRRRVRTYTDDILVAVWIAFVVALLLVTVALGNIYHAVGRDFYVFVNPIILVLYGIPTFLCGTILKFKPLVVGAIGCWILSLVTPLLPDAEQLLMPAAGMLIAWIIPGYMVRARYRQGESLRHGL
ncbi:MAG TPA: hypothetical protein VL547_15775 [Dinghuibacter sp.]|uniref:hypothetical protein n=1 Tax=Dinghuibacter sp. TaxID=2024697 RepID=UPI002C213CC6|nr:hypothetical protein [Dinghuibacter sp.]HTJ13494.1 hypothetical protein [Dinghuibacter sp.]